MAYLVEGIVSAFEMIFSFDHAVFEIALLSLELSVLSTMLAALFGVPLGFLIAARDFWGKRGLIIVFNTLLSMPTVVIGLLGYSFLSRRGLLGSFGLLFTPWAIVIGQMILAFPIITALCISAVQGVDKRAQKTALTLGANRFQAAWIILSESRFALFSAIITGFGRVFSEVGVSMMLGGNIRGLTRNITTAIAFETGKGEFALGIALGIILLFVAFSVNVLLQRLQHKKTGNNRG